MTNKSIDLISNVMPKFTIVFSNSGKTGDVLEFKFDIF